jgi:hypothetical protein
VNPIGAVVRLALPVALVLLLWPTSPAGAAPPAPISAHAMVFACCTPPEMKERIFAEAAAVGADFVRVDVQLNDVFEKDQGGPEATPDWRGLDELIDLSRRYGVRPLAILLNPPSWISACPERWPDHVRCAASDHAEFGRMAGEIAAHAGTAIDHWEIVNEPDGEWAFEGSAEQYGWMLSSAYDAIKARAPGDSVLMGGVMRPHNPAWIDRMLATPGADVAHSFDIGNVHLRGPVTALVSRFAGFRSQLARHGFHGPTWVTEQGYPADPAFQTDPAFLGGDLAQARHLTQAAVGLGEGGAGQIFVTLRDNLGGEYASEGVTHIAEQPGYPVVRRPSFAAARRLADNWQQIMAWRAEQRRQEGLLRQREMAATRARIPAIVARKRYRSARLLAQDARLSAAAAGRRGRAANRATKRLAGARALTARLRAELSWHRAVLADHRNVAVLHAAAIEDLKARIAGP